jgi:hypothetical protein
VGDGSDAHRFCISMSSRAMLNTISKLHSWVRPWVLHMDCTFKLNDNEFPLVILGVTDGAQQLHVLSILIVSHCTTAVYQRVVQGLKDLVSKVLPKVTFVPAYVMTDVELAERRALLSIFPEAQPLMCYFHIKNACEDKLRGNPNNYTITVDPDENTFHVQNLEKNLCYVVSCLESTCMCKAFAKLGYCKHVLYVLKRSNKSSVTVDLHLCQ